MTAIDGSLSVFTVKQVVHGKEPVLYVVHDEDGEWQFLSGGQVTMADLMMVRLDDVLASDASLGSVLHMKPGHAAERSDVLSSWSIRQHHSR